MTVSDEEMIRDIETVHRRRMVPQFDEPPGGLEAGELAWQPHWLSGEEVLARLDRMVDEGGPTIGALAQLCDQAQPHGLHDEGDKLLAFISQPRPNQWPGLPPQHEAARSLLNRLRDRRAADPTYDRSMWGLTVEAVASFGAWPVAAEAGITAHELDRVLRRAPGSGEAGIKAAAAARRMLAGGAEAA
jgi:hypothetical protein